MAINPIQTYLVGPSPNATQTLQFPSNVTAGDLVIVKVWCVVPGTPNTVSVSDDRGNTYSNDVSNAVIDNTGYYLQTWIWSTTLGGGGVRPIVSVVFPPSRMIGGASITEYPPAGSPTFQTSANASDSGVSGLNVMNSGNFTTTVASELLVAVGFTANGTLTAGSGWNDRDDWGTGFYSALGEDRTATSIGTYSAIINGVDGASSAGWSICAAAYQITSTVAYTDSIALGVGSGLQGIPATTFDPVAGIGVLSIEAGIPTSTFTINPVLAVAASFANILAVTSPVVAPVGVAQAAAVQLVWTTSPATLLGLSELIACSVVSSLFGVSIVGVLDILTTSGTVSTSATAVLRVILSTITDTQRAYVDSIAIGIYQAFATDSGKALVDAIAMGGVLGTNVQLANQPVGSIPLGTGIGITDSIAMTGGPIALMIAALSLSCQTSANIGAALGVFIGAVIRSKLNWSTSGSISLNDIAALFTTVPGGLLPGLVTIFDQLVTLSTASDAGVVVTLTDNPVIKGDLSDI